MQVLDLEFYWEVHPVHAAQQALETLERKLQAISTQFDDYVV